MKKQRRVRIYRLAASIWLLTTAFASAESNTSTIISGGYSNAPDGVIVGFTGTNNALTVQSTGSLNTTNWSVIGFWEDADFNTATVNDAGSVWSSKGGFYVGGFGSFNRLAILAGGKAIGSNDSYLAMDPASSNNAMLIAGSGSTFVLPGNDDLDIGYAGSDNSVTVSNGGVLAAGHKIVIGSTETAAGNSLLVYGGIVTSSWIYVGEDGGLSNRVLLTGGSSILYASNTFACGVSGRASRVEILNGARIESSWGRIGWEVGGNSNIVVVSGVGSTWSNRNEFDLGLRGSFNMLLITNGGTVWTGGWNPIGMEASSVGNTAVVTGPGSSWVITNVFHIGQAGSSNRLEIRNGGYVSNGWFAFIGDSTNAHGNSVLVTGTNSRWVSHGELRLGEYSGWNRLELRDGAFLSASNASLGWGSSDWTGNMVEVTGPGTIWTNTGLVDVNGLDTSLTVSNGATGYSQELRANAGSIDARGPVIIDGSNTQWICSGRAGAGVWSSYGTLVVTNGGSLFSADGMIGLGDFEWSNRVVVTGPGSTWSNSGDLCVGWDGIDNSMLVERGGRVYSAAASIGEYSGGNYNFARVTGSNSAWLCSGSLLVGDDHFNRLLVEDGGRFACTSAVVGWGMSNEIVVTGTGSSWSNSGSFLIGAGSFGDWNTFTVSSGACAWSRSAILGERIGTANCAVVTGDGSVWTSAAWITVGQTGRYNRLLVEDGGAVYCRTGFVGAAAGSTGNLAHVSGTGSLWSVATRLYVGFSGASNRMVVEQGGSVNADRGYIGLTNAVGSELVVDGGQMVFANFLEVGDSAYGSRLTITNGGILRDDYAILGYYGSSSNNEAVVSGPGSVWSNVTEMQIGRLGTNNSLRIERGGAVYAESVALSVGGGRANRLVVTDEGSLLSCTSSLHVYEGSGNSILVCSGATVRTTTGALGFNAGADSNAATVAGTGTRFLSAGNYQIGWQSSGNRFEVRDGAYVELTTTTEIGSRGSRNIAVVDGAETVWTNRANLNIGSTFAGYFGNRLEITNGAVVHVDGHILLGRRWDRGSNDVAVVYPDSSLIVRSNLWVISGTNELRGGTIRAGRLLMTNSTGRIAFESGTLSIDSAEVSNGVPLIVGGVATNAALMLGGGQFQFANGLTVNTNASLSGAGTVTVVSTWFENYGTVCPGTPLGRLTLSSPGVVQYAGGSLEIDLAGESAGENYDQLVCPSTFTIDGSLNIHRSRGFLPNTGSVFTVVTAGALSGSFATTNLPPWFTWGVQYIGGSVVVSVTGVETASNGVPKAWLADNGWTNNFDAAATNDEDGDHVATWEEYYAGTDPTNSSSFFQCLEISRTNFPTLGKIIRWNAVSGHVYAIEACTNLAMGWQELTNHLAAPINSWTDTVGSERRHYRLRTGP